MKFYLVGIKGSGMSALANILKELGHEVYGVDYSKKYFTEANLSKFVVCENFDDYKLKEEYFYVIGNAYKLSDITMEIINKNYQYSYYSEFIESFFTMPKIGISGSHGKTTTTCFASSLIDSPINVLIGDGTGVGDKDAEYLLFEACEYQNNFLKYNFEYLVILNIDYDHPDFFNSSTSYFNSFQKAAFNAKKIIVNYDDNECKKIIHENSLTFGFDKMSDVVISLNDNIISINMFGQVYNINFPFVGRHLVYDFVAAFVVSMLVSREKNKVLDNIPKLHFPKRRLNEYITENNGILVDDYAHHPTEIKAVFSFLKEKYPDRKLIAVFQPHTYTRTNCFLSEYIESLKLFDEVYVLPIFSSVRESEIDKWLLLNSDNSFKKYDRNLKIEEFLSSKNVIAFMGAGDIDVEFNFLLFKK